MPIKIRFFLIFLSFEFSGIFDPNLIGQSQRQKNRGKINEQKIFKKFNKQYLFKNYYYIFENQEFNLKPKT